MYGFLSTRLLQREDGSSADYTAICTSVSKSITLCGGRGTGGKEDLKSANLGWLLVDTSICVRSQERL